MASSTTTKSEDEAASVSQAPSATPEHPPLVDIGINLTHRTFKKYWRNDVRRAIDANVTTMILTGTSVQASRDSLTMARTWYEETGSKNLYATVGVHPHDAKDFVDSSTSETNYELRDEEEPTNTIHCLRELLNDPLAVAVGECGLDFNRNFSSREQQIHVFKEQVKLACELNLPLFVHEREAHEALVQVLDEVEADETVGPIPPIVIHCFTGTRDEALEYIRRGYYLGFTGTICKKERGAPLREIIPELPLENLMVETDAPFMGFTKGKRHSEPADVVGVACQLSEAIGLGMIEVCQRTTETAVRFFRIEAETE